MSMKRTSELMRGPREDGEEDAHCTLHMRKTGMKSVRRSERVSRRRSDQTCMLGSELRARPAKSPMLNMRKCIAVNTNGWTDGFVEVTETVIGGNTAYLYIRLLDSSRA